MLTLVVASVLSLSLAPADLKSTITLCEAIDSDGTTYARPIAPTGAFRDRGTEPNVHAILGIQPGDEGKALRFSVLDLAGKEVAAVDGVAAGSKWATAKLVVTKPGEYQVQAAEKESKKAIGAANFKVLAPTDGPFANGTQPSGQASLWICKEVNDDWLPVGATHNAKSGNKLFTWKADEGFNVLVKNKPKTPFGTLFLGIIIHKQGEDGRDVGFVNEYQTEQLEENVATMWCSVQPPTSLPAGRYTLYIIDWYTRETLEHNGNLKQYFAKITIDVK